MGLYDVSPIHAVGAHAAIVGALGPWETVLGPAKRMVVLIEGNSFSYKNT